MLGHYLPAEHWGNHVIMGFRFMGNCVLIRLISKMNGFDEK